MSLSTDNIVDLSRPPHGREQVLAASEAGSTIARYGDRDIFGSARSSWNGISGFVHEPQPVATIAAGADGRKIGIFLLHGGAGDYKSMDKFARLFAEKFACKVVTMTFPGRLYLDDASRDWPGDTLRPAGSARTPIWQRGEYVTPDEYDLVEDASSA